MSFPDLLEIDARPHQPVTQQTGTHPRHRLVEDTEERAASGAVRRPFDLEVAKAGAVDDQGLTGVTAGKRSEVVERPLLSALDVPQKRAGHADQGLPRLEPKASKGTDPQHPSQAFLTRGRGKGLCRNGRQGRRRKLRRPDLVPAVPVLGHQDLAWAETGEMLGNGGLFGATDTFEGPGADLDPGERRGVVIASKGGQVATLGAVEKIGRRNGSGSVGANDLAANETLGLCGVFDLFGHRHPEARVEEFPEIPVKSVVRDAAHGCVHRVILTPAGEGDAEHRRRLLRVLEKELVEIPHAIEQ